MVASPPSFSLDDLLFACSCLLCFVPPPRRPLPRFRLFLPVDPVDCFTCEGISVVLVEDAGDSVVVVVIAAIYTRLCDVVVVAFCLIVKK